MLELGLDPKVSLFDAVEALGRIDVADELLVDLLARPFRMLVDDLLVNPKRLDLAVEIGTHDAGRIARDTALLANVLVKAAADRGGRWRRGHGRRSAGARDVRVRRGRGRVLRVGVVAEL